MLKYVIVALLIAAPAIAQQTQQSQNTPSQNMVGQLASSFAKAQDDMAKLSGEIDRITKERDDLKKQLDDLKKVDPK